MDKYDFTTARKLLEDASEKGMDALEQARICVANNQFQKAEAYTEIGEAYGRFAQAAGEALGDIQ